MQVELAKYKGEEAASLDTHRLISSWSDVALTTSIRSTVGKRFRRSISREAIDLSDVDGTAGQALSADEKPALNFIA